MKEQIQQLIQQHKLAKEECFDMLQDISKIIDTSISQEEKDALRTSLFCLENEYNTRLSFLSDLENLLLAEL